MAVLCPVGMGPRQFAIDDQSQGSPLACRHHGDSASPVTRQYSNMGKSEAIEITGRDQRPARADTIQ